MGRDTPQNFTKYSMEQFVQILLLVIVSYLTITLTVQTIFGEHTKMFVMMIAILITCMVILTTSLP